MATFSDAAVEIIKRFEGLETEAYLCPANVWTIGYGRTSDVRPGDTTTEAQAEAWLIDDMDWADEAVQTEIFPDLPQSVHDALVSFTFNVGAQALADSTLAKRLNDGDDIAKTLKEELPRWVNGNDGPLAGLVRRRNAEIELALSGVSEVEAAADVLAPISLVNAAKYYKDQPHQKDAFEWLESVLSDSELVEFARRYRNAPEVAAKTLLDVRYYYQLDNGPDGYRQCFSSTNAMLLEYKKPGTLSGPNGDVEYLARLSKYGDTTDANAQVQTLRSYGIDCEFVTNGSFELLETLLKEGHPIPCGWLHYGPSSKPSGGGHWSLIVGIEGDDFIVHDPVGSADLIDGGYSSNALTAGQNVRYSKENWGPRWMVEGKGTGWMIKVNS